MKAKLMIARFPGGGSERNECVDWLMDVYHRAKTDPRISEVVRWKMNDTPITMSRNRCLQKAKAQGCDFVLMVDSDMAPDLYLESDAEAKPFYDVALDHALNHRGPCVIGAPYCGPPPIENVYVFKWSSLESGRPGGGFRLEQYTRDETVALTGVREVAALPTGVFLFDMRAYDLLLRKKRESLAAQQVQKPIPSFYYEWTDEHETDKASTEDVTFSRDLSLIGVPSYCAWDSWAGHVKTKIVGRPEPVRPDIVAEQIRHAVAARIPLQGEKLLEIKRPAFLPPATVVATDAEPPVPLALAK